MKTISLVVALDKIVNDEDIQPVIDAISQLRYVSGVTINEFTGSEQMNAWASKQTWLSTIAQKIIEMVLKEKSIF